MNILKKDYLYFVLVLLLTAILILGGRFMVNESYSKEAPRITVEDGAGDIFTGEAVLVCAYEDPNAYISNAMEGALSFENFKKISGGFPKDKKIVFY